MKQELAKSPVVRGTKPARPLWKYSPLGVIIDLGEGLAETSSYMAPWDDAVALPTLRSTSLY